ncbi:hypothetical protein MKW98_002819 [Papaver atlanticum]|uniref:Uncharacterized protein n=1 Tax=Papaver atlanticum TaxID=357466 RepID=A0AAD4S7N2_9MAGN|nr:hypothetical protein MKW98_002819 [Papaver atlanticum]
MLELDVANDRPGCTALHDICAKRNQKLTRIPKELMHDVPTPLLYSLEGMPDLDWKKLLKLQSKDGSFLFSPSSTAFALMQTKDEKCFEYLQTVVKRFDGGGKSTLRIMLYEY